MTSVAEICKRAKGAANAFMSVSSVEKNNILAEIRKAIMEKKEQILENNRIDVALATKNGKNPTFIDRLTLTEGRIQTMCDGLTAIIALTDPVGEICESYNLPNGLLIKKVRSPLGVIGIIYEARPNVTIDAAALCIKSSNGVILRGSKDALNSNRLLAEIMQDVLSRLGFDPSLVGFIDGEDRSLAQEMLEQEGLVDVIIPRGGESLKKFVLAHAKMPVIASAGGNCHMYIEKSADLKMAKKLVMNAKLSRPSVCNALETILCDREIAAEFLQDCLFTLSENGVEVRGTAEVKEIFADAVLVDDDEFYTEYEALIIKVKLVGGINEAIDHINKYSTNHSDAIVTSNEDVSRLFTAGVDSAAVYVNASTRFTDGFEFGLGAEMGISTQRLHVRGPIGLKELTSMKYVIVGDGQVRE